MSRRFGRVSPPSNTRVSFVWSPLGLTYYVDSDDVTPIDVDDPALILALRRIPWLEEGLTAVPASLLRLPALGLYPAPSLFPLGVPSFTEIGNEMVGTGTVGYRDEVS